MKNFRIPFSVFALILVIAGCGGNSPAPADAPGSGAAVSAPDPGADGENSSPVAEDADMAMNFTMKTLDGEELSLESLRGQYVLVNFWATWCIPCRKEMPYFQELADKYPEQLVVLGVNMREDAERIQPFINDMGLTFPILLDPPNDLILEHNVRGLPVSYMVGPNGKIVYRRIGEILPEEFDPWLKENLGKS